MTDLRAVQWLLWRFAHGFDSDATRSGMCALGRFPVCDHQMPSVRHTLEGVERHWSKTHGPKEKATP